MSSSMEDRLAAVHPQMLRAQGEGHHKELADLRLVIGRLVERALELLGITKQEAAFGMGYRDQGPVSRWCSATERPLFDKLFRLEGFEIAWVVAIAERNQERIDVATVVTIRSRRTA